MHDITHRYKGGGNVATEQENEMYQRGKVKAKIEATVMAKVNANGAMPDSPEECPDRGLENVTLRMYFLDEIETVITGVYILSGRT